MNNIHFIGIDLGTTKIAVSEHKRANDFMVQIGTNRIIPNEIYIDNGVYKFGYAAKQKGIKNPQNLYKNLKMLAGKQFTKAEFDEFKKTVHYNVERTEDGFCVLLVNEQGNIVKRHPEELLTMIINHVLQQIQPSLINSNVDGIIVAYPPSFKDPQKIALFNAVAGCNVRHIDMVEETTASLYYSGLNTDYGKHIIIIDCGGSTLDFTVAHVEQNAIEVEYTSGRTDIGGVYFTDLIFDYIKNKIEERDISFNSLSKAKQAQIYDAVEDAKIKLSPNSNYEISISDDQVPIYLSYYSVKSAYHALVKEAGRSLKTALKEIHDKGITIDKCILCGNGMKLQDLQNELTGILKMENTVKNADESVVQGLGVLLPIYSQHHSDDDHCNQGLDTYHNFYSFDRHSIPVINEQSITITASQFGQIPEIPRISSIVNSYYPDITIRQSTNASSEILAIPTIPAIPLSTDLTEEDHDIEEWNRTHQYIETVIPTLEQTIHIPYQIKERRAYNVYLKIAPIVNTDLKMIISRNEIIPYQTNPVNLIVKANHEIKFELYEGTSLRSSKNTKLHIYKYKRDSDHPITTEAKIAYIANVDKNGIISFNVTWRDTNLPLELENDYAVKN